MRQSLHITNGDALTGLLRTTSINGEIITWREMLCEGKTTTDVGSENFWKTRFDFLKSQYKVTKSNFIEATLKEYRRLCNEKKQEEITLWFDHDLFCQINMIAVISWLKTHRKGARVSLVHNSGDCLIGLAELTPEKLKEQYKHRIELSQDDIEYADYIWQLYCSDSPLRLETFSHFNSSQFEYLPEAIHAHITRFPYVSNGLNAVENMTLQVASEKKKWDKDQLVGQLLKKQDIFGFGDLQYYKILDTLKPLFTSLNPVKLSEEGKHVLQKTTNYYGALRNENEYLGGSLKYGYLYHEDTGKLLKL